MIPLQPLFEIDKIIYIITENCEFDLTQRDFAINTPKNISHKLGIYVREMMGQN